MFKEQTKHEMGIKRSYNENLRKKRLHFVEIMRLRKKGAHISVLTPHMDRKVEKCYQRGKAFLKMCDMHTVEQLTNT